MEGGTVPGWVGIAVFWLGWDCCFPWDHLLVWTSQHQTHHLCLKCCQLLLSPELDA